MHAFDYQAPATLADALEVMREHATEIRPLAGGTDLIDQMRVGRLTPNMLLDVKKIPELNVLTCDDSGLRIGAAVPCYKILENTEISEKYAAITDSCGIIGGVQIQSRASMGGNLCNSGPAADSTPSLIALQATCVIAGAGGTREVPVENFCTGPGKNVLEPGELLVELRFPTRAANSGSHYRRMIPRNEMDIAVVGVGASVELDGETITAARIGLGAVAPTPLLAEECANALVGKPLSEDTLNGAAEAARNLATPITDMRGTIDYRRHVTGVLVRRVVELAVARAKGEATEYRPGH